MIFFQPRYRGPQVSTVKVRLGWRGQGGPTEVSSPGVKNHSPWAPDKKLSRGSLTTFASDCPLRAFSWNLSCCHGESSEAPWGAREGHRGMTSFCKLLCRFQDFKKCLVRLQYLHHFQSMPFILNHCVSFSIIVYRSLSESIMLNHHL